MVKSGQERGKDFEESVAALLQEFRSAHDEVEVIHHPRLQLRNSTEVVPDFELTYHLPFQVSRLLIECQDRTRGSHDVIRKIAYIKNNSQHNRVIFLYKDASLLSAPLLAALEADGVLHYSLIEFAAMLFKLSTTLEAARGMLCGADNTMAGTTDCKAVCIYLDNSGSMVERLNRIILDARKWSIELSRLMYIVIYTKGATQQKAVFLPGSVEFLRRVFRAARKKRSLGPHFAEGVVAEILRDHCKEEVSERSLPLHLLPHAA